MKRLVLLFVFSALMSGLSFQSSSKAQDAPDGQPSAEDKAKEAAAEAKSRREVDAAVGAAERLESIGLNGAALERLIQEFAVNSVSVKLSKEIAKRYLKGEIFDPNKALQLYGNLLQRDGKDVEVQLGAAESAAALAAHLSIMGQKEDTKNFHQAVETAREHGQLVIELTKDTNARAHVLLGELDRRAGLDLRFGVAANDPGFKVKRAKFESDRKAFLTSARDHYRKALLINAKDPISERALVDTLIELGDLEDASRRLNAISAKNELLSKEDYMRLVVGSLAAKLAKARTPVDLKGLSKAWDQVAEISGSLHNRLSASIGRRAANQSDPAFGREIIAVWSRYNAVEANLNKTIALLADYSPRPNMNDEDKARIVPEFAFLAASVWEERGTAALRKENGQEAAKLHFSRARMVGAGALPIADEIPEVYEALGHIAIRNDLFDEAKKYFSSAASLKPDVAHYGNMTQLCDDLKADRVTMFDYMRFLQLRTSNMDHARRIRLMEALRDISPKFPDLIGFLGRLYYESGDHAKGFELLDAALKHRSSNPKWRLMHAMAGMHLGKWKASKESFSILGKATKNEKIQRWEYLIDLVLQEKLAGQALVNYVAALNRSTIASSREDLLKKALELSPKFVEASIELSMVYRETSDFSRSLSIVNDAILHSKQAKIKASALSAKGNVLFVMAQYKDAQKAYQDAIELLEVDDHLRATLKDFQSKCAFFNGGYADSERLQVEAIEEKLAMTGQNFDRFMPHRDATSQMPEARRIPSGVSTAFAPALRIGEMFRLSGTINNSIVGDGNDVNTEIPVSMLVEIQESPSANEYWRVALTVEKGLLDASLLNRKVIFSISPIFGLNSEAWTKQVGEKSFQPNRYALEGFTIYRNAVMELFTAGLGRVKLQHPFAWQNAETAGVLHLTDGAEVSYLKAASSDRMHLQRIAIADYRDTLRNGQVHIPRKRVNAEMIMSYPEMRPVELEVGMTTKDVIRSTNQTPVDVKISELKIRLTLEYLK